MEFTKDDREMYPLQDFTDYSPFLSEIDWTTKLMSALIRSGIGLKGKRDRRTGGYYTTKADIMRALELRNNAKLAAPVDLQDAYKGISAAPLGLGGNKR